MFYITEIVARPIDGGPSSDFRVAEAKKKKCFHPLGWMGSGDVNTERQADSTNKQNQLQKQAVLRQKLGAN